MSQTLIVVVVLVVLFIVFRSFTLWYWKIDEIVKNQKDQLEVLNQILAHQAQQNITKPKDFNVVQ